MELIKDTARRFESISGLKHQNELLALLNEGFRVPMSSQFYDDFPVWDEKHGLEMIRVGAYEEHRLVSSASIRKAYLKAPSSPTGVLPIGILGCVATDQKHRGGGLASQCVSLALEWAEQRNQSAVFLWGSEHSFYHRFGFELYGEQIRVPLACLSGQVSSSDQKLGCGWTSGLMKLLKKRQGGLVLSSSDEKWVSAHKNTQWYWLGSAEEPLAYAAVGRGIDLIGMIHEWGGEKESAKTLLGMLQLMKPNLELLGNRELFNHYGIQYTQSTSEFLCLAKITDRTLNPASLWFWGLDGA